jgi:hypothetical protein
MAKTDAIRRRARVTVRRAVRAPAAVRERDDACEHCGHSELDHYVDGSCSFDCAACDVRDERDLFTD